MHTLIKLTGNELTDHQYAQLNESSVREFRVQLPAKNALGDRIYFLLEMAETEKILASGYLKSIHPVICNHEVFSFLNIGGIIANEKARGYGGRVMIAIRDYLTSSEAIGLGFCFPENRGFYEKCGLKVDTTSTKRFIYRNGTETKTAEGQYVIYQDSPNRTIERILSHGKAEVSVPDPTIW